MKQIPVFIGFEKIQQGRHKINIMINLGTSKRPFINYITHEGEVGSRSNTEAVKTRTTNFVSVARLPENIF